VGASASVQGYGPENILTADTDTFWLTKLNTVRPWTVTIALPATRTRVVQTIGLYCFERSPNNPARVEVQASALGLDFFRWTELTLSANPSDELQLFAMNPLPTTINFLKLMITASYNPEGTQVFLNRLLLFSETTDQVAQCIQIRQQAASPDLTATTTSYYRADEATLGYAAVTAESVASTAQTISLLTDEGSVTSLRTQSLYSNGYASTTATSEWKRPSSEVSQDTTAKALENVLQAMNAQVTAVVDLKMALSQQSKLAPQQQPKAAIDPWNDQEQLRLDLRQLLLERQAKTKQLLTLISQRLQLEQATALEPPPSQLM
jgi:hypothetical protein